MASKRNTMPTVVDELLLSGDEYQSGDDSITVPIRRKPGRPITTGKSKAGVQKPVVPRGRGRPPKAGKRKYLVIVATGKGRGRPKAVQKVDAPEDDENGYSSAEDVGEQAAYNSPGKGRGRPKKA